MTALDLKKAELAAVQNAFKAKYIAAFIAEIKQAKKELAARAVVVRSAV